jgi:hypothetical protein
MQLPRETIKQLGSAVAAHLMRQSCDGLSSDLSRGLADLAADQLLRSPVYIGFGFKCLLHVFNLSPVLRGGRTFSSSTPDQQESQIIRWKQSRIGLFRDFVNFFESFVILGVYEDDNGEISTRESR